MPVRKLITGTVTAGLALALIPALTPSIAHAEVHYASCSEARAAGAAPLRSNDSGYRPGLDRDGDGIACE